MKSSASEKTHVKLPRTVSRHIHLTVQAARAFQSAVRISMREIHMGYVSSLSTDDRYLRGTRLPHDQPLFLQAIVLQRHFTSHIYTSPLFESEARKLLSGRQSQGYSATRLNAFSEGVSHEFG